MPAIARCLRVAHSPIEVTIANSDDVYDGTKLGCRHFNVMENGNYWSLSRFSMFQSFNLLYYIFSLYDLKIYCHPLRIIIHCFQHLTSGVHFIR